MTPHILLAYVVQTDIPDRHHQISRNIFNLLLLCSSPNRSKASATTSLLASSSCKMRKARKYAWEYFSLKKASKPVLFIYLFFIHSIMLLKGGGIGRFGAVKGIHFFDYLQILHIIISIWSITKRKRSYECHESFTNFFGTNIHG